MRLRYNFLVILMVPLLIVITGISAKQTVSKTTDNPKKTLTPADVVSSMSAEMVRVDSGSFMMGSDYRHQSDVQLVKVHISVFYLAKYEVTQAQWEAIMGNNPSTTKNCPNCPVDSVSWENAMVFISKLNQLSCKHYRLPTEAEWEYAEKDGNKHSHYHYSGSDNLDEVGWFNDNSYGKTHPIGQKKPNLLGIYDMTGNVDEWCNDWYGRYSDKFITHDNPQGPHSGKEKVMHGNAFNTNREEINSSLRYFNSPCIGTKGSGFRLASDF